MVRFFFISFFSIVLHASAQTRFSPDQAALYALSHNASLAAARLQIEEARGRLFQSGRLSNPMLEVEAGKQTMGREGVAVFGFTQQFPITGRLKHEKAVNRAQLAAAEAEVRDMERKLMADVRSVAVRILAIGSQRALRAQQLANSRDLFSFLSKRVATGEAAAVDASQVELEAQQIEVESMQLAADEVMAVGELRPLLGMSGRESITIAGGLTEPTGIPKSGSVANRPDLLAARSRVDAARSAVQEQRARRWDDVGVGLSYMRDRIDDEPAPLETEQIIGLRFTLPLPLWNQNTGRIQEAEAAATRAELEVNATRVQAQAEVSAAQTTMNAYAKLVVEIDAKVLPTARQIEDRLRNSYSTGQAPLTDVLRARARRIELEQQRVDALRDYHLARVRYMAATYVAPMPPASAKEKAGVKPPRARK